VALADIERLILLAPIEPAPTGNGLAMRAELFRIALGHDFEVKTVVVPVAGRPPGGVSRSPGVTVVPPDPGRARAGATRLLGDPAWRERLGSAGTLPDLARAASPVLADAVVEALSYERPAAVHVMRSYLAPLGVAVAERFAARWMTLDLDEDDTVLASPDEAAAYARLLGVFAPLFDGLSAASVAEAAAIGDRHRVTVEHIPNAVALPPQRDRVRHLGANLLFVGNLTYPPNIEAACALVEEVAPLLQRRARVTLVGRPDPRVRRLDGPETDVAGFVTDVTPVYGSADVVVVPMRSGAGTRIKLLEAFAYGVPVVASPQAASGLDVVDGRHLLLADGAQATAAAVETVLSDASLANELADEAGRLVRERYSTAAVVPTIRDFIARAAAGQPSAGG
jgi:glycosyltransferase involved in cell wall biosynthesis